MGSLSLFSFNKANVETHFFQDSRSFSIDVIYVYDSLRMQISYKMVNI
jgi:hypothetical protein